MIAATPWDIYELLWNVRLKIVPSCFHGSNFPLVMRSKSIADSKFSTWFYLMNSEIPPFFEFYWPKNPFNPNNLHIYQPYKFTILNWLPAWQSFIFSAACVIICIFILVFNLSFHRWYGRDSITLGQFFGPDSIKGIFQWSIITIFKNYPNFNKYLFVNKYQ